MVIPSVWIIPRLPRQRSGGREHPIPRAAPEVAGSFLMIAVSSASEPPAMPTPTSPPCSLPFALSLARTTKRFSSRFCVFAYAWVGIKCSRNGQVTFYLFFQAREINFDTLIETQSVSVPDVQCFIVPGKPSGPAQWFKKN
jgi:hypothetical protein